MEWHSVVAMVTTRNRKRVKERKKERARENVCVK